MESPFPINLWCGDELVLIYNDAYRAVLGRKHPRALGRPGSEVWAEIWDQIEPMFERIRAGGAPAYQGDAPFWIERDDERPAADQPNAWFTFSLSPVRDEDGSIVAFLNIVSETTDRILAEREREIARANAVHSEARLREVFAQAPALMAVLRGPKHVFEYANAAYYRLVGERDLIGKPVLEALPEIRGQGFVEILDGVLESGTPFVGRESPILLAREPGVEPEQRYVDFIYTALTEADGSTTGIVAHGYDVTDHVLARRDAQDARMEADKASHAKSAFLANMSHEIRTPINAILGYSDLLDAGFGGTLSDQQSEYIDRIRLSSSHLLGLVNDVLDLAKIEANEMTVRSHEASAEAAADAAMQMVAAQAEASDLELQREIACAEPLRFVGDEDRVRQILLNLLSNAVKFTDPGGAITVRCRMATEPDPDTQLAGTGPWVVIEVEDTGRGIAPEQQASVFEPFVQAETEGLPAQGGTGLGLTISRRFARLMGGELALRSAVGRGSCFSLWLVRAIEQPLPPVEAWPRATEWPESPREVPGLAALGRILLEGTETIEDLFIARLRADTEFSQTRMLDRAQVADHITAWIATLAKTLSTLDDAGGEESLLQDGKDIEFMVADRHGGQRDRLGWSRAELVREYRILHDLLDTFLRREASLRSVADVDGALGVVHALIDRSAKISLAAFDGASGGAPSSPG